MLVVCAPPLCTPQVEVITSAEAVTLAQLYDGVVDGLQLPRLEVRGPVGGPRRGSSASDLPQGPLSKAFSPPLCCVCMQAKMMEEVGGGG